MKNTRFSTFWFRTQLVLLLFLVSMIWGQQREEVKIMMVKFDNMSGSSEDADLEKIGRYQVMEHLDYLNKKSAGDLSLVIIGSPERLDESHMMIGRLEASSLPVEGSQPELTAERPNYMLYVEYTINKQDEVVIKMVADLLNQKNIREGVVHSDFKKYQQNAKLIEFAKNILQKIYEIKGRHIEIKEERRRLAICTFGIQALGQATVDSTAMSLFTQIIPMGLKEILESEGPASLVISPLSTVENTAQVGGDINGILKQLEQEPDGEKIDGVVTGRYWVIGNTLNLTFGIYSLRTQRCLFQKTIKGTSETIFEMQKQMAREILKKWPEQLKKFGRL